MEGWGEEGLPQSRVLVRRLVLMTGLLNFAKCTPGASSFKFKPV